MAKDWEDMSIQEKEEYLRKRKEDEEAQERCQAILQENIDREERSKRTKMILIIIGVLAVVALIIVFIAYNWDFLKESFMKGYNGEFIKLFKEI